MIVLGLNGWNRRSHDAAACIIKDNRLIFAIEEERIVRKKHSFDLVPIQSTLYALKYSNLTIDDIDLIAFGWDFTKWFGERIPNKKEMLNTLLPKNIFSYKNPPDLILVPHHLAHAHYSYYSSPFVNQKSAILIIDGQGERESTSFGYASENKISLDFSLPAPQSLGYFYEAACRFLGYSNLDGGKLMGLAGYGKQENFEFGRKLNYYKQKLSGFPNFIAKGIDVEEEAIDWWVRYFEKIFCLQPKQNKFKFSQSFKFEEERDNNVENKYITVAHTAQQILEKVILQITAELKDNYCTDKLVLGGGVSLNCSVNQKIIDTHKIKLHIPSSPADSGVAIGAAIYGVRQHNKKPILGLQNPYLGLNYTNGEIKKLLDRNKITYSYTKNPDDVAASLLEKNYLLGWFQNKMEFGPRALGNRSILANPLFKENKYRLNKLKGREQWRPLGVSIIEEEVKNYFETKNISPYMMVTVKANEKLKKMCPTIIHIDGTSRPQLVKKDSNLIFYNLIKKFKKLSGLPIIINTSFNRYDEPIVNSPEDALRTFFTTSLDALILNNYVITKK
jgi:carbamoyltransferase